MGVPSRSCNPRERNWEPHPLPTGNPPRAALFSPAPATLPVPYQFLAFTPG